MQQPLNMDLLDMQLAASLRGDFAKAWRIAEILHKERPGDRRAAFNRAWHLMHRGDLLGGFASIEHGRAEGVFGSPPLNTEKPRWFGTEDLRGKTVLLRGEGGFGDEILNVRFAEPLAERGARVIYACNPGLMRLLSRVPGVSETISQDAALNAAFEYWVPAMSAPLALGTTYDTLSGKPYVEPDPALVAAWRNKISGPGLKVGIRWSGNPRFEHEQHRRFPPEPLIALSHIPGVTVYSLQRDSDIRDLPESVVDLQNQIVTWDDTAAAIANLDLVITSCTSVAHLAAAMGKETWIIVPILPYHVWALPGERSPWYDSVRLFRQEVFGNWDAPLQKVKAELLKRVGKQEERTGPLKWEKASFPLPPTPSPAEGALLQEVPQSQAPVFPGFFTAPHPAPAARTRSTQSTMHFVAGLPRAGSTALLSLLAQNPRIYSAPISGLCGIFSGIYMNWDKVEYHIELPNAAAKARILRTLLEHYHETDRPIILDKDRQWITQIALLEKVLERPVKMVLPVRPITEVLASFEVLRRKNPLEFTGADSSLGSNSTIATRAAYFMQADAPVGMAFNAMGDAINSGYRDRLLFVDYNKLTSAPVMQLKRIYEFLEEPYFEHDFSHVEQVARGDSRVHKFPGLHDIHPEFKKKSPSAREVLGNEVFGKYSGTEPWTLWT